VQIRIALLIVRFRCLSVLATVQLYDQPTFHAHEIGDIGADRPLPTELEGVETASAQMAPEALLCLRRIPTQIARTAGRHRTDM
jgi:hypothetical protein